MDCAQVSRSIKKNREVENLSITMKTRFDTMCWGTEVLCSLGLWKLTPSSMYICNITQVLIPLHKLRNIVFKNRWFLALSLLHCTKVMAERYKDCEVPYHRIDP